MFFFACVVPLPLFLDKMFNRRLIIFFLVLSIFFAVILVRLLDLQVNAHQKYLDAAQQLLLRPPVLLPAVRGQIFDRNGKSLAVNEPTFNIGIYYGAIARDKKKIHQHHSQSPRSSQWYQAQKKGSYTSRISSAGKVPDR